MEKRMRACNVMSRARGFPIPPLWNVQRTQGADDRTARERRERAAAVDHLPPGREARSLSATGWMGFLEGEYPRKTGEKPPHLLLMMVRSGSGEAMGVTAHIITTHTEYVEYLHRALTYIRRFAGLFFYRDPAEDEPQR
jgi:hypothetical protein